MELMEQVLMKSFVLKHVCLNNRTHQSIQNKAVFENLSSVCVTWRKVPKLRRGFANTLRAQYDKLDNLSEYMYSLK